MQNGKNKKGGGFIVKLPDGRYRAEINFTQVNGKKSRKRSPIVNTKTQAEQERKMLVGEVNRIKSAPILDTNKCSVRDYFKTQFLPYKSDLKTQSYRRLESTIDTHIIPAHGYKPFSQIASDDVRNLLQQMYDDGLSHSTIKKVYDAYKAMFTFAVDIRHDILIEDNPMRAVKMIPQHRFQKKEIEWMGKDDIKAFVNVATRKLKTGVPEYKYGTAFVFMLNTGIRMGEICALTKEDIDFDENIVRINKGVNTEAYRREDGTNEYRLVITTPKTANSVRYVPMNDDAANCAKEILSQFPKGDKFIYNTTNGIVRPDTLSKQFNSILESAGLSKRGVHTLRHTFVSRLFDNGVDTHTIAEIIGDTEDTVRKTYLHLDKARKAKAVCNLNIL